MKIFEEFIPKNVEDWELWLKDNYNYYNGIWLIQYKKHSDNYNLSYNEALDVALCYGWIDGIIKTIDDEKYKRFFAKRRKNGSWSSVNKGKIKVLIEKKLMTEYGLKAIEIAKSNGSYYILDDAENNIIPDNLTAALEMNIRAKSNFESLSVGKRKSILRSIARIKTQVAKNRKIEKIIDSLS